MVTVFAVMLCGCGPSASSGRARPPAATASLPTATPTVNQQIIALVQQAVGKDAEHPQISYNARNQTVSVLATVGEFFQVSAGQEQVKILCFRVQKALWTSDVSLQQVSVTIDGPTYGVYGDLTTGGYGGALLGAETAAKFVWNALSPDSAWADYDSMWLTYDYSNDS